MRAAVLTSPQDVFRHPLRTTEEKPTPQSSQVQLKGRACGVCRTDLHVVDGELAPQREGITPGHQVVGDVVRQERASLLLARVLGFPGSGVSMGIVGTAKEAVRTSAKHSSLPGIA